MNIKFIHTLLFVLLLSLTAHEVHSSIIHDVENCDVCIHVQPNDKLLNQNDNQYLLLDMAFSLKVKVPFSLFALSTPATTDHIRGPPTFS